MATPYKMKPDEELAIGKCRACGEGHEQLTVHQLIKPVGVYTHYYFCEASQMEPVMLALYEHGDSYAEIAEEIADKILEAMASQRFIVTIHRIEEGKDRRVIHYWHPGGDFPRADYQTVAKGFSNWARDDIKEHDPNASPKTPEPAVDLKPAVQIFGEGPPEPVLEVDAYMRAREAREADPTGFEVGEIKGEFPPIAAETPVIKGLMAHPDVKVGEPVTEKVDLSRRHDQDYVPDDVPGNVGGEFKHIKLPMGITAEVLENLPGDDPNDPEATVLFPPKPPQIMFDRTLVAASGERKEEEHPNQIILDLAEEAERERVAKDGETE